MSCQHRIGVVLFLLVALLFIIGCENPSSTPEEPETGESIQGDIGLAQHIREKIEDLKSVDEGAVVVLDKDISIGIKVTGFQRLWLKSIREEVHRLVRDSLAEDYVIHVTTDKRLAVDLGKIERHLKERGGIASPEIQKKVEAINQDMQG